MGAVGSDLFSCLGLLFTLFGIFISGEVRCAELDIRIQAIAIIFIALIVKVGRVVGSFIVEPIVIQERKRVGNREVLNRTGG